MLKGILQDALLLAYLVHAREAAPGVFLARLATSENTGRSVLRVASTAWGTQPMSASAGGWA